MCEARKPTKPTQDQIDRAIARAAEFNLSTADALDQIGKIDEEIDALEAHDRAAERADRADLALDADRRDADHMTVWAAFAHRHQCHLKTTGADGATSRQTRRMVLANSAPLVTLANGEIV